MWTLSACLASRRHPSSLDGEDLGVSAGNTTISNDFSGCCINTWLCSEPTLFANAVDTSMPRRARLTGGACCGWHSPICARLAQHSIGRVEAWIIAVTASITSRTERALRTGLARSSIDVWLRSCNTESVTQPVRACSARRTRETGDTEAVWLCPRGTPAAGPIHTSCARWASFTKCLVQTRQLTSTAHLTNSCR